MNSVLWKEKRLKYEKDFENKSRVILPPMLNLTREVMMYPLLLNAFIGDSEHPIYDRKILLHYEFKDYAGQFTAFEKLMEKVSGYITTYDPDRFTTMFVFKVPVYYERDYWLFLEGKYSEISHDLKTKIMKFHNINKHSPDNIKQWYYILRKDPYLKGLLENKLSEGVSDVHIPIEAELASVLDYTVEIYSPVMKFEDTMLKEGMKLLEKRDEKT